MARSLHSAWVMDQPMSPDQDGNGGDYAVPYVAPSFTAINSSPAAKPVINLINAKPSPVLIPRKRNPAIAGYLGLDIETDLPRVDRSSPPPGAPPSAQPPKRKRQRVTKDASNKAPMKAKKKAPKRTAKPGKQRLISDELCATKPNYLLASGDTQKELCGEYASPTQPCANVQHLKQRAQNLENGYTSSETVGGTQSAAASTQQHYHMRNDSVDTLEADSVFPESNEHGYSADDTCETYHHSPPAYTNASDREQQELTHKVVCLEDDLLDEDIDDDDLLTLTAHLEDFTESNTYEQPHNTKSTPPASHLDQSMEVRPSHQFVSLVTPQAQFSSKNLDIKPIVRPPFPTQVRDRSPVVGLTPNCLLRTCFRVGEAINAGRNASRHGKNVIIELYARVFSSKRDETKQHFVLCDLFHANPPYLKAEYDAAIWRSVPLHDYDSRVFLGEGKAGGDNTMCRCILTTKNNGNKECVATMLNIWPAKKEDILWVEGIVNS